MILMPIVYVSDMARSRAFYAHLGFEVRLASDHWSELHAGDGAVLALHPSAGRKLETGNRLELGLVSTEPLETLERSLRSAGVTIVGAVSQEEYGRSLKIADPDGLVIQISEHDPSHSDDGRTV